MNPEFTKGILVLLYLAGIALLVAWMLKRESHPKLQPSPRPEFDPKSSRNEDDAQKQSMKRGG